MSANKLRTIVQLTGLLLALLGFWFLVLGVGKLLNGKWWGVITMLFWAYSVYVGYLAVMKLSPKAVRHVSMLSCFWLFVLVSFQIYKIQTGGQYSSAVHGLLVVLLFVGLFRLHRRVVPHLVGEIFPQVPSSKDNPQ